MVEKDGKEKKDTLDAANLDAAKEILRGEGKIVLAVTEASLLNKELGISLVKKIKPRDLSVFCRQFESILAAGVTVIAALHMLEEQTENKTLSEAVKDSRRLVEKGETLTEAMGSQPKVFPSILISMVEAGEASGNLEISFNRMAMHFEKEAKLNSMILKALIYPAILVLVVIGVVLIMMVKIVPQFTQTFTDMDAELPAITVMVMSVSEFIVSKWIFLAAGAAIIALIIKVYKGTESGALFFGRLAIKLPLFGELTIKSASAQFSRTLSTLLTAGISLLDAVDIVANTMQNIIVKRVLESARTEVEHGVPLSQPLEASKVFPPMVYHMTKIGEETGSMEEMLDKIADYYEEEVETATQALTAVLEPLIIILMAAIVVPIILAIMMPMLSIYGGI